MKSENAPQLIDSNEIVELFSDRGIAVHKNTIRAWIRRGVFGEYRQPSARTLLVSRSSVLEWLDLGTRGGDA